VAAGIASAPSRRLRSASSWMPRLAHRPRCWSTARKRSARPLCGWPGSSGPVPDAAILPCRPQRV